MTRNWAYRTKNQLKSSLWFVPVLAIPLELVTTNLLHSVDAWLDWPLFGVGLAGAQALLQAIITATLSFVVFTFGSLLVAIQIASGQLTPRIIATMLLRNNVVRYSVGLFIFSLLFAISAINRLQTNVHQLVMLFAAALGVVCFAAFLYLIDYAARLLRPISVLTYVGRQGVSVISSVYPDLSLGPNPPSGRVIPPGEVRRTVPHQGPSEIILSLDQAYLVLMAQQASGVIEFVPQVGDFVSVGEPLFNLFEGATAIDDNALRTAVSFGPERTMEQDPTFAFRIIVDIALKALSPAINDPTTAVLAIDQLHRLLRLVGTRHLRSDGLSDQREILRLIFRTPNWEDFVNLALVEIRYCGAGNIQIVRRLRWMIENLLLTLPTHRHPALQQQLLELDHEIQRNFRSPADVALARAGDSQGLGGHSTIQIT